MLTATPAPDRSAKSPGSRRYWLRPVSAESVVAFRIGFGLLVAFSSLRFLAKGWVDTLYLEPQYHLTYQYFDWVRPLPGPWMHFVVVAVACSGLAIAFGYRLRLSLAVFLIGFSYGELIDAALYLNHYWFLTVTAVLLLIMTPLTDRAAVPVMVPVLVVWALRAQLAVVYVFAGVAKLNGDWLLRAQPLRMWLADRTDVALVGPMLDEPFVAYAASWSAALFDCTIVAWLLWRRSRPVAYAVLVGFHLVTGALFQIGVFPIVMIVSTLVFFEPDWPSRFARRLGFARSDNAPGPARSETRATRELAPVGRWTGLALVAFAAFQIVMPLRHLAYPGDVRWTEEGYVGGWRVMLTEKAGHVEYEVTDPATGQAWLADPTLVLTDWQAGVAATKPDLIHRTAKLLAEHYAIQGRGPVEVRARTAVTMNGRAAKPIVDPTVDLANQPRTLAPAPWLLPD